MTHLTRELNRDAWRSYFDELSRDLGAVEATIEVEGSDLGAQVEADRLILSGISYDDADDVLVIDVEAPGGGRENLEHLVSSPKRILVDAAEGVLPSTIDIEDSESHRTLVLMRRVAALPADQREL